MTLPRAVSDLVSLYLERIDAAAPGLVTGLHIVGSAALGAWQPGHSDVDAIILTSRTLTPADLDVVAAIHGSFASKPFFDGVYLDPPTLAAQPMNREVVPFVVNSEFKTDRPCGELNPVVWLILSRYGIAMRGEPLTGLTVSPAALAEFNRTNLHEYWAPLAAQVHSHAADGPDDQPVEADWVVWTVLGPARLHYTLATGDIIAKRDVADYIAKEFPAWGPLAARAAAHRSGEAQTFTMADLRAGADHVDSVIASV